MDVRELVAHLGLEIDERSFERGREALEHLHVGFKGFAVAAGAAVTGALVYFTKETAEAADAAGKLAQSTGLNSQFLQKLSYAAELADVSTGELTIGLRHLAKSGVKDVQGEMLRLADQFAAMPNDGARVQLAMEKFGRSGAALIPLLKDGSKGIAEMMAEAEELGLVFSDEDSKAAEEFNDDLRRLGKSLTGLRNDIGRALIPVLHTLVNGMRAFMREVRAALPSMKTFEVILRTGVIVALAAMTAVLLQNIAGIILNIGWYAALSVASIRAALSAAASWAAAAAPLVIITALLTLAYLVAEDLYYYLTGGESVIGELMPDLERFLYEFTRPREEPWFIKMLRFAVELLTGVQESTHNTLRSLQQIPGFGGLTVEDITGNDPFSIINKQLGVGASGRPAVSGDNYVMPRAVTINSPITINGATGSPKEIAAEIGRQWEEQTARAHRAAQGGIP